MATAACGLAATEPDGLLLERLYRLPAVWEEQRQIAGIQLGDGPSGLTVVRPEARRSWLS